jgi:hypothetical protein
LADLAGARTFTPPSVVGRPSKGASAFHLAVQVREVRCRPGKISPRSSIRRRRKFGLPRGRCNVESRGIAVAADEQIEYRALRRHRGERSIRAGVLSLETWWIDALQSAGRTCGRSSKRVPKGAWGSPSSRRTSSSSSSESWSSRLPSSSCAFRRARPNVDLARRAMLPAPRERAGARLVDQAVAPSSRIAQLDGSKLEQVRKDAQRPGSLQFRFADVEDHLDGAAGFTNHALLQAVENARLAHAGSLG